MSDEINMTISIPTDNDGYVLLQCEHCGTYFKGTPSDLKDDGVFNIFCPSCGLISENYVTAIANAVSDSCEPAIIPDIALQTIDGKTVIVVEISEGRQQLRSWGILIEHEGKDYPSNAYAILNGCGGLHVAIQ